MSVLLCMSTSCSSRGSCPSTSVCRYTRVAEIACIIGGMAGLDLLVCIHAFTLSRFLRRLLFCFTSAVVISPWGARPARTAPQLTKTTHTHHTHTCGPALHPPFVSCDRPRPLWFSGAFYSLCCCPSLFFACSYCPAAPRSLSAFPLDSKADNLQATLGCTPSFCAQLTCFLISQRDSLSCRRPSAAKMRSR
jgi:hypothetical protein